MNRTLRYKLTYATAVLSLGAFVVVIYAWTSSLLLLFVIAVLLLIPGRIGGYYLRNLFRSRSLIGHSRFEEAIVAGQQFLAELKRRPWCRHFIYCFFCIYSWDVEAMALNNIGGAQMGLGDLEQAEKSLQSAAAKDTNYPLPYFNLAIIAYVREEEARGDHLLSIAAAKGYSGGSIDRLVSQVGEAHARLQSKTWALAG